MYQIHEKGREAVNKVHRRSPRKEGCDISTALCKPSAAEWKLLFLSSIAAQNPPPIPKPGLLAHARSVHQVGVPQAATRKAIPASNPQTPEKIALGEKSFFDGRLSADGTVACSTCHNPIYAFTDARPTSFGIKGRVGQRNAPTILNALYNKAQFWMGGQEV